MFLACLTFVSSFFVRAINTFWLIDWLIIRSTVKIDDYYAVFVNLEANYIWNLSEIISIYSKIKNFIFSLEKLICLLNFVSEIEGAPEKRFHTDDIPVVYIQNKSSWGSGVIIDQKIGLALTCGHVVNGSTKGILWKFHRIGIGIRLIEKYGIYNEGVYV